MPIFREIPLEAIQPDPQNPRRHIDEEELQTLAASIRQDGVLQPILLRPGPGPQPHWIIVAGERRWRAAKMAGLRVIPAMVHSLHQRAGDSADRLRLALVENLQRQDLSPLEEAQAYADLAALGLKRTQIAVAVKRSVPAVKNALRLLRLPALVQEHVRHGRLSASHARALCRYEGFPELQIRLAALAVAEGWTSRTLDSRMLPAAAVLLAEGLILRPPLEREPFASTCRACPLRAFHASDGYCLRPEHALALDPHLPPATTDAGETPQEGALLLDGSAGRSGRRGMALRLSPTTARGLLAALEMRLASSAPRLDGEAERRLDRLRRRLRTRLIKRAWIQSDDPPSPA